MKCRKVNNLKNIVLTILITIAKIVLNFIYAIVKIFPIKNQIVFMSRQSNNKSLDFEMLEEKLKEKDDKIKTVFLCKMLNKDIKSKLEYVIYIFKSMYYLATSKVCIVDTYCIPVSILKHKKQLEVIQIWHASGAIKKFGFQVLDKEEGSSRIIAKLMCMHKNYDYVISPSSATNNFFLEAFNVDKDKMIKLGLPRLEYIINQKYNKSEEILKKYPHLKEKKNIVYIPTFRKNVNTDLTQLLNYQLDENKYNLIISLHPLDNTKVPERYLIDKTYSSFDLIKIADYIITDYSALSIEASILEKPIFIYLYDYEDYSKHRGVNVCLDKELKSFTSNHINDIMSKIEKQEYDINEIINFRKKYIEIDPNQATKELAEFILKLYRGI